MAAPNPSGLVNIVRTRASRNRTPHVNCNLSLDRWFSHSTKTPLAQSMTRTRRHASSGLVSRNRAGTPYWERGLPHSLVLRHFMNGAACPVCVDDSASICIIDVPQESLTTRLRAGCNLFSVPHPNATSFSLTACTTPASNAPSRSQLKRRDRTFENREQRGRRMR